MSAPKKIIRILSLLFMNVTLLDLGFAQVEGLGGTNNQGLPGLFDCSLETRDGYVKEDPDGRKIQFYYLVYRKSATKQTLYFNVCLFGRHFIHFKGEPKEIYRQDSMGENVENQPVVLVILYKTGGGYQGVGNIWVRHYIPFWVFPGRLKREFAELPRGISLPFNGDLTLVYDRNNANEEKGPSAADLLFIEANVQGGVYPNGGNVVDVALSQIPKDAVATWSRPSIQNNIKEKAMPFLKEHQQSGALSAYFRIFNPLGNAFKKDSIYMVEFYCWDQNDAHRKFYRPLTYPMNIE